ncbi:RNA-binding protein [Akkermansiaceae bacterium]|nr:RNA-binding protein [Akkermansiaceae bacterium]MDC0286050.1 RNA-binding protein [Akkermansiaceae bacterium]
MFATFYWKKYFTGMLGFSPDFWSQPSLFGLPLGVCMFAYLIIRILKNDNNENSQTDDSNGNSQTDEVDTDPLRFSITDCHVYVGNLDERVDKDDLNDLMSGVGKVENIDLFSDGKNAEKKLTVEESNTYAHVEMSSSSNASTAVLVLNDQPFMGRKLVMSRMKKD